MATTLRLSRDGVSSMVAVSHDGKLIAASDAEFDQNQNTYLSVNTVVWNAKTVGYA